MTSLVCGDDIVFSCIDQCRQNQYMQCPVKPVNVPHLMKRLHLLNLHRNLCLKSLQIIQSVKPTQCPLQSMFIAFALQRLMLIVTTIYLKLVWILPCTKPFAIFSPAHPSRNPFWKKLHSFPVDCDTFLRITKIKELASGRYLYLEDGKIKFNTFTQPPHAEVLGRVMRQIARQDTADLFIDGSGDGMMYCV